MPARLKVYRTAIGFHDAYVAAASQKAALEAWGSDKNLFARGAAELVTDEALAKEPLASPGTVIKRLRGTAAEQIAALPPDRPKTKAASKVAPQRKSAQKPSRKAFSDAEAALATAETQQADARADLDRREAALRAERRDLDTSQRKERDRLSAALDAARAAYERAMADWPG